MKQKLVTLFLMLYIITGAVFADHYNFLQSRSGVLIKIDVASGLTPNYPEEKGPYKDELPLKMSRSEYEDAFLPGIEDEKDRQFVRTLYATDPVSGDYELRDDIVHTTVDEYFIKDHIVRNFKRPDKDFLDSTFVHDRKNDVYLLNPELPDGERLEVSRHASEILLWIILLENNEKNEMHTGVDQSGMPMPHGFPRVFEAKSRSHLDLHFSWGVRFDNDLTLGFSLNFTNIVMPSFEIMVKYNFEVPDVEFEPYIGGAVYGGLIDGFPIGFNLLGGMDFYPKGKVEMADNLFLSGEMRLGTVLYSKVYFDKGINRGGIWKEYSWLAEGGFYFNVGNLWYRP
jgi:hypothetical protein